MSETKILAGSSGFSYKPWKGPVYPADMANEDMLGFNGERLPTVGINNTFYRMPNPKWWPIGGRRCPRGFALP